MRPTLALYKASGPSGRNIKALALSVYFKQPDFGMTDYEVLSRASAFLLSVDPLDPQVEVGPYGHLEKGDRDRKVKMHKQEHRYTPAGGSAGRDLKDLGWLEFAPQEVRPIVHCVCSSHVLAPFLWKDYYPQDWLSKVRQEHCVYSLEVFEKQNTERSLGKFALNPYPIHHPEGRDVALVHLKREEESLKLIRDLGVEVLHLRDLDRIYEKDDEVFFDGYVVAEANNADSKSFVSENFTAEESPTVEDTRVFFPYQEAGRLAFHTRDRFFANTAEPLPEGLCGGAVLDGEGTVCGIVEGIVDKNHSNKDIAGSAAFMPNYILAPFIEFAERFILQKILPKSLFQKAVTAKTTNSLSGGIFERDTDGTFKRGTASSWEEAFDRVVEKLKKNHSREEVEAILDTIQRERREVFEIMERDGGDLDEVAERVRNRTMEIRELIHEEFRMRDAAESAGGQADDSSDAQLLAEDRKR